MASAKENVSRVQPCACVMGCNHKPNPCRIPIESVTMAAPKVSTWNKDKVFTGERELDAMPKL